MSLASGLRVGGVFVDVKLDTSGLAGQFRDLKSQMDRLARQHQLAVPMGAAQGSTSSTGGGSRPIMPSFAIGGSQAGVISAINRASSTTNALLRQIAADMRVTARTQFAQDRAARDFFRADRAGFQRANASRLFQQAFTGRRPGITGPEGPINTLPADVRFLGGVGFDESRPYQVMRGGAAQAPAMAAQVTQAATQAATTAAVQTAQQIVTRIGVTPQAAAMGFRPGHYQRRRDGSVGFQFGNAGGVRQPAFNPSNQPLGMGFGPQNTGMMRAFGGLAGGMAGAAVAGPAGGLAGTAFGMAPVQSLRAMGGLLLRTEGLFAGLGHTAQFAMNRTLSGIRAVQRGMERAAVTTGPLRTALALPFRAAMLPLRLFSRNVDESVRTFGTMGALSRGLQTSLASPFRLALSPLNLFTMSLRNAAQTLTFIGAFAAGSFLAKGIQFASEMNETVNVADQTFRDFSGAAIDNASEMARRYGAVEESILETSNTFGLLLTGMNMAPARAAELSNRLANLSADMSSFFNVSQGEAAGAIQSALRGRFQPISRFGVMIRKEDVSAIAEARGETTRLGEAVATLDLVMSGLSVASGDLQRTMNAPANLMREFRGRVTNLAGEIGQKLLPAYRQLLLAFNDVLSGSTTVGRFVSGAFDAIGERATAAIRFVRQAFANMEATRDLITSLLGMVRENASNIMNWIVDAAGAVATFAGETMRDVFIVVFEALRDTLKVVWEAIGEDLVNAMGNAANRAGKLIGSLVGGQRDVEIVGRNADGSLIFAEASRGDGAQADPDAIAKTLADRIADIMARAGEFRLPEFTPDGGEATDRFNKALEEIRNTFVRGDDDDGVPVGPRGRLLPEMDDESGRSRTSRSGSMVSAEELRNLQNQDVFNKENRERQREIARNTARSAEHLATLAAATGVGGGLGSLAVAVAAP